MEDKDAKINLLEMQLAALEDKRAAMNRLYITAKKCRAAQKAYFANRTQSNLAVSRDAEHRLDSVIDELTAIVHDRQFSLNL